MIRIPSKTVFALYAAFVVFWILGCSFFEVLGEWSYFVSEALVKWSAFGLTWITFRKVFKDWRKIVVDCAAYIGCNALLDELVGIYFRYIGWDKLGQPTQINLWEYIAFSFFLLAAYQVSWKYLKKPKLK